MPQHHTCSNIFYFKTNEIWGKYIIDCNSNHKKQCSCISKLDTIANLVKLHDSISVKVMKTSHYSLEYHSFPFKSSWKSTAQYEKQKQTSYKSQYYRGEGRIEDQN